MPSDEDPAAQTPDSDDLPAALGNAAPQPVDASGKTMPDGPLPHHNALVQLLLGYPPKESRLAVEDMRNILRETFARFHNKALDWARKNAIDRISMGPMPPIGGIPISGPEFDLAVVRALEASEHEVQLFLQSEPVTRKLTEADRLVDQRVVDRREGRAAADAEKARKVEEIVRNLGDEAIGISNACMRQVHRLELPGFAKVFGWHNQGPVVPPEAEQETGTETHPRATVGARMMDLWAKKPESIGWSAREYAIYLDCSKTAVIDSPAWEKLMRTRAMEKIERASSPSTDGRRTKKRRPSD